MRKEPKQETIIAATLSRFRQGTPARKTPGDYAVACDAAELCRIGRSLTRLAEYQCSSPNYGEREEKRFMRLLAKAESIAADYGLLCSHSHDPRGACLRIGTDDETRRHTGTACL